MAQSNYYLGRDPVEILGDSPRYWYALRRNQDGELFIVRSDQVSDKEAYSINIPGPIGENFEDFGESCRAQNVPDNRVKSIRING